MSAGTEITHTRHVHLFHSKMPKFPGIRKILCLKCANNAVLGTLPMAMKNCQCLAASLCGFQASESPNETSTPPYLWSFGGAGGQPRLRTVGANGGSTRVRGAKNIFFQSCS